MTLPIITKEMLEYEEKEKIIYMFLDLQKYANEQIEDLQKLFFETKEENNKLKNKLRNIKKILIQMLDSNKKNLESNKKNLEF